MRREHFSVVPFTVLFLLIAYASDVATEGLSGTVSGTAPVPVERDSTRTSQNSGVALIHEARTITANRGKEKPSGKSYKFDNYEEKLPVGGVLTKLQASPPPSSSPSLVLPAIALHTSKFQEENVSKARIIKDEDENENAAEDEEDDEGTESDEKGDDDDDQEDDENVDDENDDVYVDELKAVAESHEAMSKDEIRKLNGTLAPLKASNSDSLPKESMLRDFESYEKSFENDGSDENVASNEAITDELIRVKDKEISDLSQYKKKATVRFEEKLKRVPTVKKELSTQREIISVNDTQLNSTSYALPLDAEYALPVPSSGSTEGSTIPVTSAKRKGHGTLENNDRALTQSLVKLLSQLAENLEAWQRVHWLLSNENRPVSQEPNTRELTSYEPGINKQVPTLPTGEELQSLGENLKEQVAKLNEQTTNEKKKRKRKRRKKQREDSSDATEPSMMSSSSSETSVTFGPMITTTSTATGPEKASPTTPASSTTSESNQLTTPDQWHLVAERFFAPLWEGRPAAPPPPGKLVTSSTKLLKVGQEEVKKINRPETMKYQEKVDTIHDLPNQVLPFESAGVQPAPLAYDGLPGLRGEREEYLLTSNREEEPRIDQDEKNRKEKKKMRLEQSVDSRGNVYAHNHEYRPAGGQDFATNKDWQQPYDLERLWKTKVDRSSTPGNDGASGEWLLRHAVEDLGKVWLRTDGYYWTWSRSETEPEEKTEIERVWRHRQQQQRQRAIPSQAWEQRQPDFPRSLLAEPLFRNDVPRDSMRDPLVTWPYRPPTEEGSRKGWESATSDPLRQWPKDEGYVPKAVLLRRLGFDEKSPSHRTFLPIREDKSASWRDGKLERMMSASNRLDDLDWNGCPPASSTVEPDGSKEEGKPWKSAESSTRFWSTSASDSPKWRTTRYSKLNCPPGQSLPVDLRQELRGWSNGESQGKHATRMEEDRSTRSWEKRIKPPLPSWPTNFDPYDSPFFYAPYPCIQFVSPSVRENASDETRASEEWRKESNPGSGWPSSKWKKFAYHRVTALPVASKTGGVVKVRRENDENNAPENDNPEGIRNELNQETSSLPSSIPSRSHNAFVAVSAVLSPEVDGSPHVVRNIRSRSKDTSQRQSTGSPTSKEVTIEGTREKDEQIDPLVNQLATLQHSRPPVNGNEKKDNTYSKDTNNNSPEGPATEKSSTECTTCVDLPQSKAATGDPRGTR